MDFLRVALVAGLLWAALQMSGPSASPARYKGPYQELHSASRSVEDPDRAVLAEALATASDMLAADSKGLVATTEEIQRFILAFVEFSYVGTGKPLRKYPEVADLIEQKLSQAYGKDVVEVTPELRAKVVDALAESGRAVR